jgi:predicted nucleotidyltransferase
MTKKRIPDTLPAVAQREVCPAIDPVIGDFTTQLKQRLGIRLRGLWLFGSRARGDARPDSDYDLLILIDSDSPTLRDQVLDLQAEMLNRHDALVATLLYTEDDWQHRQGYPLAKNIAREAVRL